MSFLQFLTETPPVCAVSPRTQRLWSLPGMWVLQSALMRDHACTAHLNPFYIAACLCRRWTSTYITARASYTRCFGGRPRVRAYTGTPPTYRLRRSWFTTQERTNRLRSKSRLSTHSEQDQHRSLRSDTPERTVRHLWVNSEPMSIQLQCVLKFNHHLFSFFLPFLHPPKVTHTSS